jgi:hypothetical protein
MINPEIINAENRRSRARRGRAEEVGAGEFMRRISTTWLKRHEDYKPLHGSLPVEYAIF